MLLHMASSAVHIAVLILDLEKGIRRPAARIGTKTWTMSQKHLGFWSCNLFGQKVWSTVLHIRPPHSHFISTLINHLSNVVF